MYLHLGSYTTINTKNVVGVFDLDTSTISPKTRDFLTRAEKGKQVLNTSTELPKSFVVTEKKERKREKSKQRIYICQLSPATLKKRYSMEYSAKQR